MAFAILIMHCSTAFLGILSLAFTETSPSSTTIVDPSKADKDYHTQGEYLGTLTSDGTAYRIGLQVVARSNGAFEAEALIGGLPGAGWKQGDPTEQASGQRIAEIVSLKDLDDPVEVTIKGKIAEVRDKGRLLGGLKKVQRQSPSLQMKPPKGAEIIFDGTSTDALDQGQILLDNLLAPGCQTRTTLDDHQLHLEFRIPYMPHARGSHRGNSGVIIQGRYEIEILDSFGSTHRKNLCGSVFGMAEPLLNMCLPPLTWQTYDYFFTSASYSPEGIKKTPARLTLWHNGVLVHQNLELHKETHGQAPEAPRPGPLVFQQQGTPVYFRNIWFVRNKKSESQPAKQTASHKTIPLQPTPLAGQPGASAVRRVAAENISPK